MKHLGKTPPFRGPDGGILPNSVAEISYLRLGGFDQWVMDASPFTHVPKIPGEGFTVTPLVMLTAVAALLIIVGLAGFRRRDTG